MSKQREPRIWIIKKDKVEVAENYFECVQIAEGEYVGNDKVKVIEHSAYQRLIEANKKLREGLEMASQEYWNKACSKDNLTWSEFQDAIFQILSEAGKIEGGS